MSDAMLARLADVLIAYSTEVHKGDLVVIAADPIAMPAVRAIYRRVLEAGGHPVWVPRSDELGDDLLESGTLDQIAYVSPLDLHRVETMDVQIGLWADHNTRSRSRVDPGRLAAIQQARKPFLKRFLQRAAEGTLRWCGTQYPTEAAAQDAERSLRQYEKFVYEAGLLHLPDPVAEWRRIRDRQERVREYLQKRRELRFRAPAAAGHDGTDLRVNVDPARSTWINCCGKENFPDGEVFTGPQGVDGHVNFTFPAVYNGREVEGVRLAFKAGRVVDASASKNESFLVEMLDQDAGARTLGEIAIGTNYGITEFTRNTLFDEKIGGTFHAACGAGYPESGSSNESGLHWDMVCDLRPDSARGIDGGTIEADGEAFHRDGRFIESVIG
ncbi:MAG TPA: aminopeptidase [Phycisphaerales bacterium]|nr:aminopeptidase [Phycisphaerales bacterium]